MKKRAYLREIKDILLLGGVFYRKNHSHTYYDSVLDLIWGENCKLLVRCNLYGTTANPLSELGWVIRTTFKMSPKEFLKTYEYEIKNDDL